MARECIALIELMHGELPALQHYVCTDAEAAEMHSAASLMTEQPADGPTIRVEADALARLWYTSGTTGQTWPRPPGSSLLLILC